MDRASLRKNQETLIAISRSGPILNSMGMALRYNDHDQAVFTMPYNPHYDHAGGAVHGGVLATMLDTAGWFTVCPHYGVWVSTVEFQTRLLEVAQREELVSVGTAVRLGKSLATATMEVRTGAGRLVAAGSGTFAVTSAPLPEPG